MRGFRIWWWRCIVLRKTTHGGKIENINNSRKTRKYYHYLIVSTRKNFFSTYLVVFGSKKNAKKINNWWKNSFFHIRYHHQKLRKPIENQKNRLKIHQTWIYRLGDLTLINFLLKNIKGYFPHKIDIQSRISGVQQKTQHFTLISNLHTVFYLVAYF